MRIGLIAALALFAPAAALAQESRPDIDKRLEEFNDSALRLLKQLQRDLEPVLREFGDMVESLDDYEAPEMLPNGDIIIRRKRPKSDETPGEDRPKLDL